jgi:hypothetical protein
VGRSLSFKYSMPGAVNPTWHKLFEPAVDCGKDYVIDVPEVHSISQNYPKIICMLIHSSYT